MKQIWQFEKLIYLLYILLIIYVGVIVLVPVLMLFDIEINIRSNLDTDSFAFWIFFTLELIVYLLFLLGVYFLRRVSLYLREDEPFKQLVIKGLNRSGTYMILSGLLSITSLVAVWVYKLVTGELSIGYGTDLILTLFIIIVGLFFKIQSNALMLAMKNKEELDLVV